MRELDAEFKGQLIQQGSVISQVHLMLVVKRLSQSPVHLECEVILTLQIP